MKKVAIIQARSASARLPGKVLMGSEGKPMLWHIMERVSSAKMIDETVIATSTSLKDNQIEEFARKNNFKIFRGSEHNCLDRYYWAAKKHKANMIVRITGDCPLILPEIIDKLISEYLKGRHDYVTNTLCYTYPDGCDVEVFSFKALEKAWKECKDPLQKEHVTLFIKDSGKFKLKNMERKNPLNPTEYKWSVDKPEDLEFVREVYRHLYKRKKIFSIKKILNLLDSHPEIKKINQGAIVNEGYYRSILNSPRVKPKKIKIRKSIRLKRKTEKLIPGCSQTFSKGPSQFVQGIAPVFLESGKGSHV